MKVENRYLQNQVFSVVIVVLLGIVFYILAASGLASGSLNSTITPLLLIIIAITCLALLSEVLKLGCMLSKKGK